MPQVHQADIAQKFVDGGIVEGAQITLVRIEVDHCFGKENIIIAFNEDYSKYSEEKRVLKDFAKEFVTERRIINIQ
jgi:hypothetical protein